jgi:hypothetical protein
MNDKHKNKLKVFAENCLEEIENIIGTFDDDKLVLQVLKDMAKECYELANDESEWVSYNVKITC